MTEVPIRNRVVDVLGCWITEYFSGTDESLIHEIAAWAEANAKVLSPLIEARKSSNPGCPATFVQDYEKLNILDLNILDFTPQDIAHQITLEEMILYKEITVEDCLDKIWSLRTRHEENSFQKMSDHWNKVDRPLIFSNVSLLAGSLNLSYELAKLSRGLGY